MASASPAFVHGIDLMSSLKLERFPFLIEESAKKADNYKALERQNRFPAPFEYSPARWLQSDYNSSSYPIWCPRDCPVICNNYSEFVAAKYDGYHVPLSLVGHGGTAEKPAPPHVAKNRFARSQYSYFHLPFNQLAGFVNQLHPDDRFVAFLLTEGNNKTHIYADVDADLDTFPEMKGKEEEYISHFIFLLYKFFKMTFKRMMDLRGLLLLQASNEKKMSWHVHIRTEAFEDVKQLKLFIQDFRSYLEKGDGHQHLHLCVLRKGADKYVHVVDVAPYGSNQNFRCPGNQKPGKKPLLQRTFFWALEAQLKFTPEKDPPVGSPITPEVLFNAHPNLALPTIRGYRFLKMEQTTSLVNILKRKSSDVLGTRMSQQQNSSKRERRESSLTDADQSQVRRILSPFLGDHIQFGEVSRDFDFKTSYPCIKGTLVAKTAYCPFRGNGYVHKGNRMRFQIMKGTLVFSCFDSDCKTVFEDWKEWNESLENLVGPGTSCSSDSSDAAATAAAAP